MTLSAPVQIVVGPRHHGVVEYADDLARSVGELEPSSTILRVDDAARLDGIVRDLDRIHLQVTDGIFGTTPDEAALRIASLCAMLPTTLTLHDVPQPSDGDRNLERRAAAYRQMTARAVGVAVSSSHERALIREFVDAGLDPMVIPLGTRSSAAPTTEISSIEGVCRVLIAGYLYPGKGHDDTIRAAALFAERTGVMVTVVAVGAVSAGHETLAQDLHALADASGVELLITGHLDVDDYRAHCRGAGVPVVAHQHYSASRSLLDWAECGRRPVVVETAYTREMAALRPGSLRVSPVGPGEGTVVMLAHAIEEGYRSPSSTVLEAGHPIGPTVEDAAAAYLGWWRRLPW